MFIINTKKTPLRRCTGCGEMFEKSQLIRVAKSKDGVIALDCSHKMEGRGGYVCKNIDCYTKTKKIRGFERTLKSRVPLDVYETMEDILDKQ